MEYKKLFNSIWNTDINKFFYEIGIYYNNGFKYKYIRRLKMGNEDETEETEKAIREAEEEFDFNHRY